MPFSVVWLSLLWSASLEVSPVLGDCFAVAELLEVVPLPVWETVFPFPSVFVCSVTCAVAELGLVADASTGSCCACGLLAFGLEKICLPHLGAMVTVLLELVITGAVYWFLLLMLRSFRGQDLNYVPGGKVLRAFGKTLRLL